MLELLAFFTGQAAPAAPIPETPKITSITLLAPSPGPTEADLTAPLPPDEGKPGQRAQGNLLRLIGTSDYPTEALKNGEEGSVAVRLSVTPDGRVSDCTVIESSNSSALDSTTCRLLSERAKFRPARDAKGEKTTDTFVQRVHWGLPSEPFEDTHSTLIFTFDGSGKETSCMAEDPDMPAEGILFLCNSARGGIVDAFPAADLANRQVITQAGFRVGGPEAAFGIGQGPGETMLRRFSSELTIAANGRVTDCRVTGVPRDEPLAIEHCKNHLARRFDALPPNVADRSDRHGIQYVVDYSVAKKP